MAAHDLAKAGLRVLLLEREPLPRYKTCGGGLVGKAVALLPEAASATIEVDCRRAGLHLSGTGLAFTAARAVPIVCMTMRARLDYALTEWAVAAGAGLHDKTRVTGVAPSPRGVTVTTDRGVFTAPLVVAADGVGGVSARAVRPLSPLMGPAVEWEITVPDAILARFSGTARFDVGAVPHGYGWVFPKRDHLSVGLFRGRPGRCDLNAILGRYLAELGIAPRKAERHGHRIPVHPGAGPFAAHGVLLTGDAAGLAEAVTGEGISGALESGKFAARAILEAGGNPQRAGRHYTHLVQTHMLPELAAARRCAGLLHLWPRLTEEVFRHFGQSLCERVTDVMAGALTWREVLHHAVFLRTRLPAHRQAGHRAGPGAV